MKVLSIKQPWTTLIALGEKRFETRSWKTHYRGKLGIHASKSIDKEAFYFEEINQTLKKHGILQPSDLPVGQIIAIGNLRNCHRVTTEFYDYAILDSGIVVKDNEFTFGDFSIRRYAWELVGVERLETPIQAKGQLGLWDFPTL